MHSFGCGSRDEHQDCVRNDGGTTATPEVRSIVVNGQQLVRALSSASVRNPPVLHVVRERDVGLFSLIQQVIANVPWALSEGRVPVVDFRGRTCYWTPDGRHGRDSVWEYYFEAVVPGFSADTLPRELRDSIETEFPDQTEPGRFINAHTFVSNHFGDHPSLTGMAPVIPYLSGNPDPALRQLTSEIIQNFVRPRQYVMEKVEAFFDEHMRAHEVIGVHVRGTDAVSTRETRTYRRGSLDLDRFIAELDQLLAERPRARIFVATDAQASLNRVVHAFNSRVIAYDAVRHVDGELAGDGPTGCIMPGYIATDRETAAQNGEDAVVEYLLLRRCRHLVHNGASLATTVLLAEPRMPHTNTHAQVEL